MKFAVCRPDQIRAVSVRCVAILQRFAAAAIGTCASNRGALRIAMVRIQTACVRKLTEPLGMAAAP